MALIDVNTMASTELEEYLRNNAAGLTDFQTMRNVLEVLRKLYPDDRTTINDYLSSIQEQMESLVVNGPVNTDQLANSAVSYQKLKNPFALILLNNCIEVNFQIKKIIVKDNVFLSHGDGN
ncbi:hypothetical protein [Niallia sp. NCCP-28]|uniref:hypothetical protein n=1 Tax=Niallia sp. NCCP-28 TaxID=2934712 RepID=UPI0020824038|nr:hypothetical protein [Niallia sp. NCCP-28]GKU82569.1 hypothetical protein NCCP28_19650 [Niallia sp. NCCP-28]